MHNETKATQIPPQVKEAVWKRDGGVCIVCGNPHAAPNSHVVKRSHGGMGIETNIVTMCTTCHEAFDGMGRSYLLPRVERYLKSKYKNWKREDQIYHK